MFFFFNDTATTEIYTLSLPDALPIWYWRSSLAEPVARRATSAPGRCRDPDLAAGGPAARGRHRARWSGSMRSEEHTSELQSLRHLVCRLLLEKKKKDTVTRSGSRITS